MPAFMPDIPVLLLPTCANHNQIKDNIMCKPNLIDKQCVYYILPGFDHGILQLPIKTTTKQL